MSFIFFLLVFLLAVFLLVISIVGSAVKSFFHLFKGDKSSEDTETIGESDEKVSAGATERMRKFKTMAEDVEYEEE